MSEDADQPIDFKQVREMLDEKKGRMKLSLSACAGCTLCAESCFMFMKHDQDPEYMPSYKVLNTLGLLYKKKGKLSRKELEKMSEIAFKNCMLCERCYCPLGIDSYNMIAFVRSILRSQGIYGAFPHSTGEPQCDCQRDETARPKPQTQGDDEAQ